MSSPTDKIQHAHLPRRPVRQPGAYLLPSMQPPGSGLAPLPQYSRGFWASMDLLLTFLILISLFSPLLAYAAYSGHHASEMALSRRQFSILLQEAHLAYANAATPRQLAILSPTTDPQQSLTPDTYYSHVGYLDPVQFALLQSSPPDPSSLGLAHLEFSLTPPSLSNPNQICVRRLMLLQPLPVSKISTPDPIPLAPTLSIPPIPQRVWACGW